MVITTHRFFTQSYARHLGLVSDNPQLVHRFMTNGRSLLLSDDLCLRPVDDRSVPPQDEHWDIKRSADVDQLEFRKFTIQDPGSG